MQKICTACKEQKPLSEFFVDSRAKDGRQRRCKQCAHAYYAAPGTMQKYASRNLQRRHRNQQRFKDIKSKLQCVVCGEREPACLDFHHTDPTTKERSVSMLVHSHSWKMIEEEINKCVILCANCHRKVHANIIACPSSVESDTPAS